MIASGMSGANQQVLELYRDLMVEVRVRIHIVEWLLDHPHDLPAPIVRECAYLQFRLICELIALGCLVVHEDIPATRSAKLSKEWAADAIMNRLVELHPHFYPQPFIREQTGERQFHHVGIDPASTLPRDELITLYALCGGVLHKGSLKKLLRGRSPIETKFDDIRTWLGKLGKLLNMHWISRLDGIAGFICLMDNPETSGVQVAYAEAMPERLEDA